MPTLKTTKGTTGRLAALALTLGLAACGQPVPPPETSGELRVGARNTPATYYIAHNGEPAGFEHDLLQAFGRSQGWSLTWVEEARLNTLFEMLDSHQVHLVAATLPRAAVRDRHLITGPVLFETPVHVVYRASDRAPRSMAALEGKRLALITGSGHTAILMRHKRRHPGLAWDALDHAWPEQLLDELEAGKYDAVVINGMDYDALRNFYPGLAVAFDVGDTQKIVWALSKRSSQAMRNALARFIEQARKDGTLARIYERYFGHVRRLGSSDILGIMQRRPERLPELRPHFHEAQTLTGIDWRLLAAIGYQESQWNSYATSPTGVRGLMMLTTQTADRMGVANRLDARQSILGGARYLVLLKESLPARIPEPDRTWLALAAYNQGLGHMEDARRIAQARGGNPDSWADVKEALPYLSRGTYAGVMKYGHARGIEALNFAENVRSYYDILQRLESRFDPMINLGRSEDTPAAPG